MRGEGQRVFKRIAGASAFDRRGTTPDGARTRDRCRDSTKVSSNLLKLRVTDGFFWRSEVPTATLIGPLSDPRPLPCKPLPLLFRIGGSCVLGDEWCEGLEDNGNCNSGSS